MARYRLAFDIESDDPTVTNQKLQEAVKAAEEYTKIVILPDKQITYNKSAESHRTVHLHKSTLRRSCQHCVDLLASDLRD